MIKRLSAKITILATVALLSNLVSGQETSYLTQKLMLENDIRKKITEALSKIIDQQKYVIDVSVDLELSSEVQEQITVAPSTEAGRAGELDELTSAVAAGSKKLETGRNTDSYLPIPGFEFEMSGSDDEPEVVATEKIVAETTSSQGGDQIVSRVLTDKRLSVARIRKMDISLILQEGAAPELVENIRQIVMVAARYNRARGDALSIMTASFKERRDQRSAEAILLKSIADKVDAIEKQRVVESAAAEADWRQELEQYKQAEVQRRDQERSYFQTELDKLETAARARAYEQQRRDILQRDSLRLIQLNNEIQTLRSQMEAPTTPDAEIQAAQSRVQQVETERSALDAQISEKIATLEGVQAELDKIQGGMNNLPLYLMGFVTLLAVVALVIVLVMTNRSKPRYAPPPPWMMPPPRRKKKRIQDKLAEAPMPQPAVTIPPPPPAPITPITPVTLPPVEVEVSSGPDQGVVQSEINDMRKAVVSMSVGQPETATRIVREWMGEEAPPPPPEPVAPPAEVEAPDTGKKKKK
ncbi:MAG: flagellar M-ring protein FliF C-terminal domain-containing protein [Candidatus Neomarinimicrobiota bacterium]